MSSSSSHPVRRLSLYCPELDKEWFNFLITPSMTWNDMIKSIQAALQYHGGVWPADVNGEPFFDTDKPEVVFNFASIRDGEKLVISLRKIFRFNSLPDLEVVLYLEEEDPDTLECALKKLEPEDKRIHMEKLRRRDGAARKNICRIVLPHSDIKKDLAALNNVSESQLKQTYSAANSIRHIREHWRAHTASNTQDLTSDLKCLAMIDIFSKALIGQHYLGEEFLHAAAKARIEAGGPSEPKGIQQQDVLDAIQTVYEAANAIDSTWDDTTDNKAINKRANRKNTYKAGKKGEAATARNNADAEYMGEGAAEAAFPGKGKGKAVDMITGRLEKTMLPDNYMDDDDDDDDDDNNDDNDSDYEP